MVLGAIVIIFVGIALANYFKDRGQKGTLPSSANNKTEVSQTAFGKTHIVVKGESLWTIAEKEIGSGYNWVDIAKENNIQNPSLVYTGQKLVIPSVESKEGSISGATYEVVKGDNLWTIAVRAYGDGYKWTEIAQENNLTNPNLIHPGNILALPR